MKKLQYADTVLAELTSVLAQVDDAQAEQLIEKICQAQTVFLAGSGRVWQERPLQCALDIWGSRRP